MDAKNTVTILDSTLRDGAQGEGISFSLQDKISIVQILDELGVTYIEAGNPSSNPKDELFFAEMKNIKLTNAKLAAFGSTRRKNTKCEKDENLLALLKADTPVITLFGKSWPFQVTDILHTSLQQNLDMIYESVNFCVSHGKEVIFDAEHFFEGWKQNGEYALKTLEELLPCAMANNMVLAVENSFELPNSAKEVMGLINHFNNHPNIGACYDSGHANCMATAPGKSLDKYEPYFYTCWWENGVIPEDNALETMASQIVTCHLHDNTGYGDLHGMPLDGTINWKELVPKLKALPRLTEYQSEVCMADGKNWAGQLLAPVGGYSIKRLCDTFKFIGF